MSSSHAGGLACHVASSAGSKTACCRAEGCTGGSWRAGRGRGGVSSWEEVGRRDGDEREDECGGLHFDLWSLELIVNGGLEGGKE